MSDQPSIIRREPRVTGRVEIVRSFSYKLNTGNYESRDFFCSQKVECAAEDAETISEKVYQFCKTQVLKAVHEWREQGEYPSEKPVRRAS